MNQGIDITFARKPGARISDAKELATALKHRLPLDPMDLPPMLQCSASISAEHPGFMKFETMMLLTLDDPNGYLKKVVRAIHSVLLEDGWELYDKKNASHQTSEGRASHPKNSLSKKWWEFWK
jgi:hypothetical protein